MSVLPPPPENLALLVEHLGVDDTLRLIEARGGTQMDIPNIGGGAAPAARERLAAEFGEAMAKALIRGYGGGKLWVPLCAGWRTAVYAAHGLSRVEIAKKLGCHVDTVSRRLARRGTNRGSGWDFGPRARDDRQSSLDF